MAGCLIQGSREICGLSPLSLYNVIHFFITADEYYGLELADMIKSQALIGYVLLSDLIKLK